MSLPALSPFYGNSSDGPFDLNCNVGSPVASDGSISGYFVNGFVVRLHDEIDTVGVVCTNGTEPIAQGGWGGDAYTNNSSATGYDRVTISSEDSIEIITGFRNGVQMFNASADKNSYHYYTNYPTFSCPSGQVVTRVTGEIADAIDGIQFRCGFDCSNPVNALKSNCDVFRQASTSAVVAQAAVSAYCLAGTNMTSDPKCHTVISAAPLTYASTIGSYCQGDVLFTDEQFCSSLCNLPALNGTCDTAINEWCAADQTRIISSPEICGLYMPQAWYNSVIAGVVAGVPASSKSEVELAYAQNPICWLTTVTNATPLYEPQLSFNSHCPDIQLCVQTINLTDQGVMGGVNLSQECSISNNGAGTGTGTGTDTGTGVGTGVVSWLTGSFTLVGVTFPMFAWVVLGVGLVLSCIVITAIIFAPKPKHQRKQVNLHIQTKKK